MNTGYYYDGLATAAAPVAGRGFYHRFVIGHCECGLLYRHGKLLGRLEAGRHRRLGFGYALSKVDLRKTVMDIAGQEVLSLENVGLKVSVLVAYRVQDPVQALHGVQNWHGYAYQAVQLALRSVISTQSIENLLQQRLEVGSQLLARVQPEFAGLGLAAHSAEIKDVMFPGELKKVFGEVLRAKQEGQAALERARGESAALRNLANAARLLENNPALQNLRLMQCLSGAGASGNTLVMGVPAGFAPLKNGSQSKAGNPPPNPVD